MMSHFRSALVWLYTVVCRAARALWHGLVNRKGWEFAFQAMQGIGTVVLTILAIYGVFFTDLPTILIRQLQAEVADTKEDVVLLKREKLSLEDQITALTAATSEAKRDKEIAETAATVIDRELSELRVSLEQARRDLGSLTSEKAALVVERDKVAAALDALREQSKAVEKQVARLTSERDIYLNDAYGDAIDSLIAALEGRASAVDAKIRTAEYLQKLPTFAIQERELDERLKGVQSPAETRRIIDEWVAQRDPDFLQYSLTEDRSVDVAIAEIRERLTKDGATPPITGVAIVEAVLDRKDFKALLERDWNAFNKAIVAMVEKDNELLSLSLTIEVKENFSDLELASEISRARNALAKFRAFIQGLPEGLAERLKRRKA